MSDPLQGVPRKTFTFPSFLALKRPDLVLIIGLVILIVNAIVAFQAALALIRFEREAKTSLETLMTLEQTLALVRNLETGVRGFVITGQVRFLEPFRTAERNLNAEVTHLVELIADDPDYADLLAQLRPDIAAKVAFSDTTINLRMNLGFDAARDLIETGRGRAAMDSIRVRVRDMQALAGGKLDFRSADAESYGHRTLLTLGIFSVLSLLLLSSVHLLARRDMEKREQLAQVLRMNNQDLEVRVRDRTVALETANELLQAEVMERQKAEEQLTSANVELTRSNRELQDFAYVASHDLQEPLRKIMTFSSMLELEQGDHLDEAGRSYLERLSDSASRMSQLISDLLTFSRVTTRAQPFQPVDLNKVVHAVLSDLEIAASEHDAEIDVGELPTLGADEFQMRQLFQNLIGNALKFQMPGRKPVVKVSAEVSNDTALGPVVAITVSDNGIGFDEKYLDKIFTPFQRLHNRSQYAGTGIGLSICRRIVERHNGTITAHSKPDQGSTFVVTLPLHPAEQMAEQNGETPAAS
ncbi:MAG TPA: CHASE3 domain-containing protein [Rhodothermales bacterium]|nr:CHASE3 domain-containing protein [Rhodothermales bacterium]